MIVATDIIVYDRMDAELEELILFLVAVAGKNADTTARALDSFFYSKNFERVSPFRQIRDMDTVNKMLHVRIKNARLGNYTRLEKAFRQLANSNLDLRNCTLDDLMEIHGVGRKSASCFLAWTRKDVQVAMLDTHLLKYLREVQNALDFDVVGYTQYEEWALIRDEIVSLTIPKSTPPKKLYDKLEAIYLDICKLLQKNPTEYDLELWKRYAGR